jgi:cytoskeletal protein RodZ
VTTYQQFPPYGNPVPPPRKKRRVWPWVLLGVLILFAVGIGGCMAIVASAANSVNQQSQTVHNVTYKMTTQHDSKVSVGYSQSTNAGIATSSVGPVSSPWSVDTKISGFGGPNMNGSIAADIDSPNKSDTITCTIIEDGKQVATNSSTGPNASVSCSAP